MNFDSVYLGLLITVFILLSLLFYLPAYKRRVIKATLEQNPPRLDALFENMSSGVAVFNVLDSGCQFLFTAINLAAERIDALDRAEVIGKDLLDVLPNSAESGLLQALQRVWQTGVLEKLTLSYHSNNDVTNWRDYSIYPLPNNAIVIIYDDVSQHKQAERILQESELRLRILGDNLPDSYLYEFTYQNGLPRFLYVSSGVENIHGVKIAEVLADAMVLLAQIAPEQQQAYLQMEEESRRNLQDFEMELHFQRQDGESRWLRVRSHPYQNLDGQIIWDGIAIDMTEKHLFELEINRLAQAVEQSPVGILITDLQGGLLFCNQAYTRMSGYQFVDMYRKSLRELISVELTSDDFAHIQAYLSAGKPWVGIIKNQRKQGDYYWEHISIAPVYDDKGSLCNYLQVRQDITETKRAEEELRRYHEHLEEQVQQRTAELILARDAAEAANRAKSVFLASMSHELRTPLNAILGFSNLMRQDPSISRTQTENLDIINRSGEHLLTLINDVLDMAKIEAGRLQIEHKVFDLGALVRDVVDMMQIRAQEKNLKLILDQSSAFPRYIKGDEARLRQVLINLVGNAVKFTDNGGVTVRLGVKENTVSHLLIEVEDTGCGISDIDQQRIFEPFVQVNEVSSHLGSGLGLTITRQFVQLMGGTLSINSVVDQGSLFLVNLPLDAANINDISGIKHQCGRGNVIGLAQGQPIYRVLIVDDQRENQLLMEKLMQVIGFPTRMADTGAQAVQRFIDWKPDFIWMDRRMPVMDGFEAVAQIRTLPGGADVKIVALTASAFNEQRDELLQAGMDDFVRKPYRFSDIYDCLNRLLGVEFDYQQPDSALHAKVVTKLTSDDFALVPKELRLALYDAVENLDSEQITAIIADIKLIDENLAKKLAYFAGNFDYPAILNVVQPLME